MHMITFVFIFVFNLTLYQAKTQTYGAPRYAETNSHKPFSGNTSPTFVVRIKRQSHIADPSGVSDQNIKNTQGEHNIKEVDKKRNSNSNGYFHNTDIGNRPNNRKNGINSNFPPVNSALRYPKPEFESNVGNKFSNNPPQRSDSFNPDIYNTDITKRVTRNKNIGNKVGNHDPRQFDNFDARKFNTQNPRGATTNNKQFDYADGVSIVNIGNGHGKQNIIDVYDNTKNTRRGTTINNIGNGFGNRNEVNIQENADGLSYPHTVLSPYSRRQTNTQQTNYQQNWYSQNSYMRQNNNHGFNNDQDSHLYTRIGQGTDNRNFIFINGVPVFSDSSVKHKNCHQRRGLDLIIMMKDGNLN
ncbi:GATA zinc finger domain-containing protein 14-like isoform X2 [Nymphalis io]|uniref:GATA zinc finger domain-containing protein 14-like isoform X2 n=1 Tax=Inachis io TaxID=171585 RepID=UPI002169F86C|nr:GATA zinc finger domain-containing protein 14-like isoform X2 [Nymphalis io]